jgi:hypothetical protein
MAGTIVSDTIQNGAGASTSTTNVVNGVAKSWVNFNGISGASIRSSYNVSSVTYVGTGQYTVNFTTAFSSSGYVMTAAGSLADGTNDGNEGVVGPLRGAGTSALSPTNAQISTSIRSNGGGGFNDLGIVCVAFFGN